MINFGIVDLSSEFFTISELLSLICFYNSFKVLICCVQDRFVMILDTLLTAVD